ncbi:Sugar phosphate isomerase/epimerase [Georgenia satyanarayanai]|uniref:Sugar phosphate isomerase/epimerase n=1 Tax=Georgenia satyanarayanai TaxID=860221 RepID=A0A2Y9AY85_9MICO|nr:sugar phosphate isomerase/epimerase family protein [Georgenia satyanarayanai]PYF96287.1 sugar phosphate isomerase/epimerase [Georgenia satyanarayanai]SSA47069.1 Sugar phosphate isomerase/epimerase [Georgenia satyanarayanai]
MSLRLSYGTNGFTDHRLPEALAIMADLGYEGVALTLDHQHLDPFAPDLAARVSETAALLERYGLAVAVETGARYVLDPWRKHEPTFVSEDGAEERARLIRTAVDVAGDLGADIVHLWSGTLPPGTPDDVAWERLVSGLAPVLEHAERAGVRLAFEPEPGMFVSRLAGVRELRSRLGDPAALVATVDVGHAVVNEEASPQDCIRENAEIVAHVQIEDMRRGVHEHLEFGEGEVDVPASLRALLDIGYDGLVSVELTRHSHDAPAVAARSLAVLRSALDAAQA